jgi:hypothetical protein
MDDCLRCHGMHFEGGVRDLVTPLNTAGPWRIVPAEMADRPTMPCLTCHGVHRQGALLRKAGVEGRIEGPSQETIFSRSRPQDWQHIPFGAAAPAMLEGERPSR